ncbi:MAG: toll/interleukin-1 receptor domain-containing protein [Bauldia sp.]|nr:toll/interleukin-1 receptor domain-containing protein [Bauldia sp.]
MSRIFLSYASSDKVFASKLRRALTDRGAEAFDPHKDLRPGEDASTFILNRLKWSDLLIFVVPRYEGQGKSALVELGAAKALGKRIVSVLPDRLRAANSDVASALGATYFLDASGENVSALAERVLSDLKAA